MKKLLLIFATVLFGTGLRAEEAAAPDKAASLTMLQAVVPRDPAALGMGATSVLEAVSIANSAFSNPGVIPFCSAETDFTASYESWQPELPSKSRDINVGFAYNYEHKFGVAIAFATDILAGYDVADENGVIRSEYKPSNMVAAAGIAYRFLPALAFSATARYLYSNIYDNSSYGSPSFDAGLTFGKGAVMAAAGISNLAADLDGEYPLPTAVYAAGSYLAVAGESELEFRAEADAYLYGALRLAVGGSWTYDKLAARLGYNFGGKSPVGDFFSMGLGFNAGYVHADAALLLGDGPMNRTFCVGLGFSF